MPRIPDAGDFGARVVPQSRGGSYVGRAGEIGAEGMARTAESIGETVKQFGQRRAALDAADGISRIRETWARKFLERQETAGDDADGFAESIAKEFDDDLAGVLKNKPLLSQQQIKGLAQEYRGQLFGQASRFEHETRTRRTESSLRDSIDRASVAASLDPDSLLRSTQEMAAAISDSTLPPENRAALREELRKIASSAAIGLAKRDPAKALASLALPTSGIAAFDTLTPAARAQVEQFTRGQLVDQKVASIVGAYSESTDAGLAELKALGKSGIAPDLLDNIRAGVGAGVSQLRAQRRQEHVETLASIDRQLATDTTTPRTEQLINRMYQVGALSPDEYGNALAHMDDSVLRRAKAGAGAASITQALAAGLPLDPMDPDHKKGLANYFEGATKGLPAGSEPWLTAAQAVAQRTRMLPEQAVSWTRSALRSPDERLVASAAGFFGQVNASAPDALSLLDDKTRSFADQVNSMIEAGTDPKEAVKTSRENVFQVRDETLKARDKAWAGNGAASFAGQSSSALADFIDRDFDRGLWAKQPAASDPRSAMVADSLALEPDFRAQTERYFRNTGDIARAREMAWNDVKRVYGPSDINGAPQILAFPPERFGVTRADVDTAADEFLKANPQTDGTEAADVVLVPDAMTLRAVGDTLQGRLVRPSYALVGKSGEPLLNANGTRARFELPSGEEITKRMREAQSKAEREARTQLEEAKRKRESLRRFRESFPLESSY